MIGYLIAAPVEPQDAPVVHSPQQSTRKAIVVCRAVLGRVVATGMASTWDGVLHAARARGARLCAACWGNP